MEVKTVSSIYLLCMINIPQGANERVGIRNWTKIRGCMKLHVRDYARPKLMNMRKLHGAECFDSRHDEIWFFVLRHEGTKIASN